MKRLLSRPARRLFEWGIAALLIATLISLSLYYIRQLEREVRLLLIDSLERSLSVQLFITHQQIAKQGQLANPHYTWQVNKDTYITTRYGYPATNSPHNLAALFEPLSEKWTFDTTPYGIHAYLDQRPTCGLHYQAPESPGTSPSLSIYTDGC
ncbi:hypothetical protein [Thiorhodospira sibirica]|uniref:hypothetical protein n=1 Tax=Thiorhodospira sibirica TaxID=154347 RepID=UPI00022C1174|nr:hypothetical protein [Thiorhodospira sibirica]